MARRQPFFTNPPKRGKNGRFMKSVRGRGGRKVSRAAWRRSGYRRNKPVAHRLPPRSASGRFMRRSRRNVPNPRRRRRRYTNAPRRRRRRSNPPQLFRGGIRGILNDATRAAMGGAGVSVGKITLRQALKLFKKADGTPVIDPNTWLGVAAQGAVSVGAGVVLRMFGIRGAFADGVVYGIMNGAVESGIRLVAPEQASKLLGQDEEVREFPLSAYPLNQVLAGYPGAAAFSPEQMRLLQGW